MAILLNVVLALFSPREASARADEREVMIELKAERISSFTLSAGAVCLIGTLLLGWNPFLVANLARSGVQHRRCVRRAAGPRISLEKGLAAAGLG